MKLFSLLGIFSVVLVMLVTLVSANPVWNTANFTIVSGMAEGSTVAIDYAASAPDSGVNTFSMQNAPSGATFTQLNATTARFSFSPTFTQAGNYVIGLNVSDANSTDTKSLTLSVADLASSSSTIPTLSPITAKTVNEGNTLTFNLTSTAPDFGTNTFSKNVSFGSLSSSSNLAATFTWTPSFNDAGVYDVRFNVADGDSSNAQVVTITVVNVPAALTSTNTLSLGSSNQRRSNPRADDVADREVNISGDLTITNTGSESLTNLSLAGVATKLGFSSSDLRVSASFSKTTLSVGESATATVTARVPEKLDAVDSNLLATAFNVATLTFSANSQTGGQVTSITDLRMQAENQLKIKDADVATGTKTEDVDDGDSVEDLRPGDHITIIVEAENKYADSEDVEMEDIEFSIESDDLDIDEEEEIGSLSPKDQDSASVEFDIDEDADDDDHDVEVRLEGRDENGARHGEKWTIQLEVKRESHEIAIDELSFSPSTITCEKETELIVVLRNVGRNDEDEVSLRIESPELKYGVVVNEIEIEEDEDSTHRFVVPIKNLSRGSYRLTATTYYEFDQLSNRDAVLLTVGACGGEEIEEEQDTVNPPVQGEPQDSGIEVVPTTEPPVYAGPTPAEEQGFFERPEYTAVLVIAFVIVLAGVIWLLSVLFAKP